MASEVDTRKHTHRYSHENNFKKPGTHHELQPGEQNFFGIHTSYGSYPQLYVNNAQWENVIY